MKRKKKANKIAKAFIKFIKSIYKSYKTMKNEISKALAICFIMLAVCACGSTRVAVDRPAQGTQTTITVTTNNPISTEIVPTITAK